MIHSYHLHIKGERTGNAQLQESAALFKNTYQLFFGEECGPITELKVAFEFSSPIVLWRNHDYSWVDVSRRRVANFHSPKALMLKNGHRVVASETNGLWEFDPKHPKILTWVLADHRLTPLFRYDEQDNMRFFCPEYLPDKPLILNLLFTKGKVPEFSRSRVPFSAILNFSDHCDFDALELMKQQRMLFKKCRVRVSKGVFLYHHSKRDYNVSLERNGEELKLWKEDGHELCYHSLTQSIRPDNSWQKDFETFENSDCHWPTWIDHAYQPYNLTKMAASGHNIEDWARRMHAAGIRHFWNYLDAGHSGAGLINQLDVSQFALCNYINKALRQKSLSAFMALLRTYILYFSCEKSKRKYSRLVNNLRRRLWRKSLRGLWGLMNGLAFLLGRFLRMLIETCKKEVLPEWQKYGATFFSTYVGNTKFWFFQTVEVHDFISTFSEENLKLLIESRGICLAHTYFADNDPQKKGRLFLNGAGDWMPGIEETFQRIGDAAANRKLWLASVSEIAECFENFQYLRFDVDEHGNIYHFIEKEGQSIDVRYVD